MLQDNILIQPKIENNYTCDGFEGGKNKTNSSDIRKSRQRDTNTESRENDQDRQQRMKRSNTTNKHVIDRKKNFCNLMGDFTADNIRRSDVLIGEDNYQSRYRGGSQGRQENGQQVLPQAQNQVQENGRISSAQEPEDLEGKPLCASENQPGFDPPHGEMVNEVTPNSIRNTYNIIESQFQVKQHGKNKDWIAKNQNEKPQTFISFKDSCKNWDIDEVIIFEMWDETHDSDKNKNNELNFQKMLINNMESVIRIFFRGAKTLRVKRQTAEYSKRTGKYHVESSLNVLEKKGTVQTRVRADSKVKQFHAGQIFDYLKKNIKLNTNQCLLVLTNADLYPKEGWTFVFGMTKQSWRICIQSYARHHPDFGNNEKPQRMFTNEVSKKVQYRAIKTACHELSHVLSIRHCQAYECLMNGSSSLVEADQKPFALCPVCLRKLSYYLGFQGDELERYQGLREVFKLMNHNDTEQNFKREIELFDKIINRLKDAQGNSSFYSDKDKEGGNQEFRKSQDSQQIYVIQKGIIHNEDSLSRTSTNQLTNKPLSANSTVNRSVVSIGEILNISPSELEAHQKPGKIQQVCNYICCCFTCFQRPDDKHEYNNINQQEKNGNKRSQKLQMKQSHMAIVQSQSQNNSIIHTEEMQNLKQDLHDPEMGISLPSPKIYDMDAEMQLSKVAKRYDNNNPALFAQNKIDEEKQYRKQQK